MEPGSIIAVSIAAVGLCMIAAKWAMDISMSRRPRNKCRGQCGQYGWTNLSEDHEIVNARCNRCGWTSQYSKKQHS